MTPAARTATLLLAAGALLAPAVPAWAAPSGPAASGTAVVVHGLRGLVADVSVDGKQVLTDFAPARVTDPLPLAAGAHAVEVRKAGTRPTLLAGKLVVAASTQTTAAVGLSSAAKPALMQFRETPAAVPAGAARVIVRDIAATGPVTVALDGKPLGGSLTNAGQVAGQVTGGPHTMSLTGADVPAQQVTLTPGRTTVMYLTGSAAQQTLSWIGQILPATAASATSGGTLSAIQTGDSGLVPGSRDRSGSSLPMTAGVLGAVLLAAGALVRRARVAR